MSDKDKRRQEAQAAIDKALIRRGRETKRVIRKAVQEAAKKHQQGEDK